MASGYAAVQQSLKNHTHQPIISNIMSNAAQEVKDKITTIVRSVGLGTASCGQLT